MLVMHSSWAGELCVIYEPKEVQLPCSGFEPATGPCLWKLVQDTCSCHPD